jgi:hypothetical protein
MPQASYNHQLLRIPDTVGEIEVGHVAYDSILADNQKTPYDQVRNLGYRQFANSINT